MSDRSWMIGRAPDCDVVIDNPIVSSHHCRLTLSAGRLSLDDLKSANGTYVNGNRIAVPTAVSADDRITLGKTVPFPWPDGSVPPTNLIGKTDVETAEKTRRVNATQEIITIGRAPDNDIQLDYPAVSSHHARIIAVDGQPYIEDLGSTNGTSLTQPGKRISRAPIGPDDVVFFGSFRMPAARLLEGKLNLGNKAHDTISFSKDVMVFGRAPGCDKVLSNPSVSARHARLTRQSGGFLLEDLHSSNGTYVNGKRIDGPTRVSAGDIIGLGTYTFKIDNQGNLEQKNLHGNVTLEVRGVTVDVPGKRLIEDVSLTIYPSEFVGLMGPSGAGKTTLMNALNGYTPPTQGEVLINGDSLYADYGRFAPYIGYVPQDDIMHKDLTVGQALYYTAKLRLPSDFTDEEINRRIDAILKQLELEGARNVLIGSPEKKGISGGQRKRVNLAMELLSDPLVLFLDEPTSGLSSRDALNVMQLLRRLADSGKTILLTIHQPSLEVFKLMDSLALVSKDTNSADPGRLVYFGPNYPDAVNFFNPNGVAGLPVGMEPSPDEILAGLDRNAKTAQWRQKYLESRFHREYVVERAGKTVSGKAIEADLSRRGFFNFSQFRALTRRCFAIKKADAMTSLMMILQAPIIGVLALLLFAKNLADFTDKYVNHKDELTFKISEAAGRSIGGILFFSSLAVFFFGCFHAVREIVNEWAIYKRERMVVVKIVPYLASKWVVLGVFTVLQSLILLGIVHWFCELKGSWGTMFVFLLLNGLIGVGIGLFLSAISKTSERAMSSLVPVVLLMVLFGGALIPLRETFKAAHYIASVMSLRWSFEGLYITEINDGGKERELTPLPKMPTLPGQEPAKDEPIQDMAEKLFPKDELRQGPTVAFGALLAMLAVVIVAPGIVLKLRDVH
jgi:ABC-type multidrug transport system ATPase subunit/pSer/pThr/pTyr-binding forkhead associated (FHA) protein/ABC-type multidrug transport system permease subunit